MMGCSYGRIFRTTVAGGSYQEGLSVHLQGVPPGLLITEEEIYSDLLLRKPGQGELASPRREPDLPIIYSGVNAADTMPGFENRNRTNGTPLVILIPNLDRHFEHIEQYRSTNRTPRPGHASYASYLKYGPCDDAIGAGFFSGRYTATIVAAGAVAQHILRKHGIEVCAYVKEAAGVRAPAMPLDRIRTQVAAFKRLRRDHDLFLKLVYREGRITPEMRFLQKMAALAEIEKMIPSLQEKKSFDQAEARAKYGVHPLMNCPDLDAADEMVRRIIAVRDSGDSTGGVVEVIATGVPPGMGEPVFDKLDGELGRLMSIGTVKAVEIGVGLAAKDLTGSQCNDQMFMKDGKVCFASNRAGGITGGLTTGQEIVVRLAIKPTPTIAKPQRTVDKVALTDAKLAAVTRRDPTIVARVWPVAEAFTALVLLDQYAMHLGYQTLRRED
jgi:chorismate synthase